MAHTPATNGHHHAHHFDSAEHEFESSKQGMWLFMATEILMFGGIFVAYFIFRAKHLATFHEVHHVLSVPMGALNTIVLIVSSLTMVLGVAHAQRGENKKTVRYLIATILLACVFMVVKFFEYQHKFHEGTLPGGFFDYAKNAEMPKDSHFFFSIYFAATGLHGLHVLIGIGLIAWIARRASKNEFGPNYYTPVELVGYYWHLVDLVWIYLFPLLYLVS